MLVSNLPELGILVRNVAHGPLFLNLHHFGIIFQRIQGISVEILEPFLKFVFVEPLESPQYQPMKVCLQRELLALASQSDSIMLRKITGFLANILPCLQVSINNFAPVLYSFTFLIDLNKMYRCLVLWWVYKHLLFFYVMQVKDVNSLGSTAMLVLAVVDVCLVRVQETEKILRKLLTFLLDLCWEFQAQLLDISMVTKYLLRAAEKIPSVSSFFITILSTRYLNILYAYIFGVRCLVITNKYLYLNLWGKYSVIIIIKFVPISLMMSLGWFVPVSWY